MSAQEDPPRLFSPEAGASDDLRLALGAAREDLPSAARLEAILASLPLSIPSGGDGGTSSGPGGGVDPGGGVLPDGGGAADVGSLAPATGVGAAAWMKLTGVVAVGAALAGIAYVRTQGPTPQPAAPSAAVVAAPTNASTPSAAAPLPVAITSATASASASTAKPTPPIAPPSSSAPVRPEIEILREAQAALGSNPARALALTDEHARSHPKGSLGQEREMVRIQALVALGRAEEARALAEAFKKRNPSSAYAQRLDAMFP